MRNIVIICALLAAASTAGWFTINRDGDHLQIDINRAEVRSDTRVMIERGREMIDRQQQSSEQRSASQAPGQAPPWPAAPTDAWGNNISTNYTPERGFSGPPQNVRQTQQPSQPYGYPDAGYPRQAAPYSAQPTYPR